MGVFEKKRDMYFALCAVVISALFLLQSLSYADESAQFPTFLTGVMFFLAVVLLIKSFRVKVNKEDSSNAFQVFLGTVRCALAVMIVTSIYVLGILYIGYFVSTAAFFLTIMVVYGKNKLLFSLGATSIFLAIIYGLFVSFLGISLPQGLLL